MLIKSECQARFESDAGLTSTTNLISVEFDQQAASNTSQFTDVKAAERRQRRRLRSSRNIRSVGFPMGGWKVSSW
ncbi:MAG: hypothetical protein ACI9R7_000054 [Lysobacterales bacterium]|jgi:hypothetical protein